MSTYVSLYNNLDGSTSTTKATTNPHPTEEISAYSKRLKEYYMEKAKASNKLY